MTTIKGENLVYITMAVEEAEDILYALTHVAVVPYCQNTSSLRFKTQLEKGN